MDINSINFDNDKYSFSVSKSDGTEFSINLAQRNRINMNSFNTEKINDNTFKFTNDYTSDGAMYAWYVIDKNSAKAVIRANILKTIHSNILLKQKGNILLEHIQRINMVKESKK